MRIIKFICCLFLTCLLFSYQIASAQVGIGTTVPDASSLLDLSSTAKGMLAPRMTLAQKLAVATPATGLLIYQTDGAAGFWYYDGTAWRPFLNNTTGWTTLGNTGTVAGTNFIGTTDAVDFVTKTNNVEKMRVTSAGNVGIGTSTPTTILSVNGDVNQTIGLERNATANNARNGNNLTILAGGGQSGQNNKNGGDLNLTSGLSTGSGTSNINFQTYAAGAAGSTDNTATTKMTILGNGNVGINTATPGSTFDVKGTIRLSGSTSGYVGLQPAAAAGSVTYTLPFVDGTNGQQLTTNGSGILVWAHPAFNTAWNLIGNTGTVAGTNFIGTIDNVDFVTKTNNTEKTRVTSAGNFGIGTSTPTTILSATGDNAQIFGLERNVGGANGQDLTLRAGGAKASQNNKIGGDLYMTSGISTGSATSNIYLQTATAGVAGATDNTPSTKMTVLGSGNVGISTTNPGSTLDVKGIIRLSGSTSGYVGLQPAAAAGSTTYTLPTADGTNGQALLTNGSATLSWGVPATTHTFTSATNTLTSTVNGVVATANAVNSVSNTSATNSLTTTINGVAGASVNIINSNATSLVGASLTTTVNGVAAPALDLTPAIISKAWSLTGNSGTVAGTNFIGTTDAIDFVTKTNNTEKTRVTSAGNFGIGTATPTTILSANGNVAQIFGLERITGAPNTGSNLTIRAGGAGAGQNNKTGGDLYLNSGISTGTGTSNIYMQTATAGASGSTDNTQTTKMTVLGNGNVGVGTTAPAQLLETMNGKVFINNNNNTSGELRIAEPSTSGANFTAFKTQAQAADITYTLPATVGGANMKLTTDGTGVLSWSNLNVAIFSRKTADESVVNSTTLQDDNDFTFPFAANATYEITMMLKVHCSNGGKIKMKTVAPAGSTAFLGALATKGGNSAVTYMPSPAAAYTICNAALDENTDIIMIQGTITTAGTAGTFKVQWAQDTSDTDPTTIFAGSYCKAIMMQ
jgi:hypothetical protein